MYFNILKSDGYYRNGKVDKNYNTDGITRIVNITPKSISDEALNIDVFFCEQYTRLFDDEQSYLQIPLCPWDYGKMCLSKYGFMFEYKDGSVYLDGKY